MSLLLENAAADRVDVWTVTLEERLDRATSETLSLPERAHAARLRVGANLWAAGRVQLRRVLARYLGLSPGQVSLVTSAEGKPRLAPSMRSELHFSVSHCGNVVVIAVRLGNEVGVDIEAVREGVDSAAIAREHFLAHGQGDDFFRAWTRREALAKASGRGIAQPYSQEDAARFTARELDGIPGCAAAVASEGTAWSVRLCEAC